MAEPLTNPRSERVRSVARLAGRSARRRAGLFLAEGPSCVREALRVGAARDVYGTAEGLALLPELHHPRVWECTDEVLAAMADTVTPQGVIAVCHVPEVRLADVLAARPRLVAVLAHVRDPGNAGTAIRAADAAGADAVLLTDASVDPFNPKCVRSTTGSLFSLPVVPGVLLPEAIAGLREAGCAVLAADGAGTLDLDALQDEAERAPAAEGAVGLRRPTAWVFGNEAWGMSEPDRALADAVVRVPIHGRAESLNLAMAATVCLYASARAQRRP